MANLLHSFRPCQFHYDVIQFTGGMCPTPKSVQHCTIDGQTWILLSTHAQWLMMATKGNRMTLDAYGESSLIKSLHDITQRACDGEFDGQLKDISEMPDALQNAASAAGANVIDDPMQMIEVDEAVSPAPSKAISGQGRSRKRFYKNCARGKVLKVEMAALPPEVNSRVRATRTIKLLMKNRQSIWLAQEDVPWAVEYLYQQAACKGVALIADDDSGPSASATGAVESAPAAAEWTAAVAGAAVAGELTEF